MYKEFIDKLKPLPKFNLNWYHGVDEYSDGDIEDDIIKMIAENNPEEYTDAIDKNFTWPTYYYLVRTRKNIINWYPFKSDASVLEIGCGLGALTAELCDRCSSVTAVELSKRRATAALLRCREKDNLEIIVGNLNDISFEKKFDYIILNGVLEYQVGYTNTENPYRDFLIKIKGLLAPQGKLLIAIENQYGLKYWCGVPEDHAGIPFTGINQYSLMEHKAKTFSREGLARLIRESGFKHQFFYYPLPDYKLPVVIYSQDYLPKKDDLADVNFYSLNPGTYLADEQALYNDVIENGVFEFFANSFLVECSDSEDVGECKFAVFNEKRVGEYRLGTRIMGDKYVEKFPLATNENVQNHMCNIQSNLNEMKEKGLYVIEQELTEGTLKSPYMKEMRAEDYLIDAYIKGDTEEILAIYQKLYEDIIQSSNEVDWEKNAIYDYGLNATRDPEKFGIILENGYIDMLFRNAFYCDGHFVWFDQEWKLENIPAKYMIFRTISFFYGAHEEISSVLPLMDVYAHFDIDPELQEIFMEVENKFQSLVLEGKHKILTGKSKEETRNIVIKNINKIISG